MKIKLSKSQWELVGKKAGWIKQAAKDPWETESKKRGLSDDDVYDVKRDYHGNLQNAQRDSRQPKQNSPQQQEFIKVLESMVADKESETYKAILDRIEQNEYNSKFHLINSIKKRVATPTPPPKQKSKFEPEQELYYKQGVFGKHYRDKPLPPEIEAEKQSQIKEMTKTLVEQAGMNLNAIGTINLDPWSGGKFDDDEAKKVLMDGVKAGKWDKYLAEKFFGEMKRSWDISLR